MDRSTPAGAPPPPDQLQRLLGAVSDLGDIDHGVGLDGVLQRIVEIACEITGARYGALGVLSEGAGDGGGHALSHFISHGMSPDERAAIAHPPMAGGILGRLIAEPVTLRLADVSSEPDAIGFPPGHPHMKTFLGAPIRTGAHIFGNLYLTEKADGQEFTRDDEVLLEGVASLAGVVIDLTQRRLRADGQHAIVATIRQLNRSLLTEDDPAVIVPLVIEEAMRSTSATAVAVGTAVGPGADRVELVTARGVDGVALFDAHPDAWARSLETGTSMHWATGESAPLLDRDSGPTHTSVVPITLRDGRCAVMVVDRWRPQPGASPLLTEELIESLGDQVGLVLDRISADEGHDALTKVADRERIARDLHDLVIQRIFAAGLTLQGAARMKPEPEVLERVEQTITELDATIRDIRATIFALSPGRPGVSLHAEIRDLVASYAQNLGFTPTVTCAAGVEEVIDEDSRLTLLLVLREALSNVARHAQATSVEIVIRLEAAHVVVLVTDDGVGPPTEVIESGLGNARARARQRGGSMDLMARTPRGTVLRWQVPLA
ncbi:MAG: GAF domain-containing protein, partial [Ornithinimicrobium sp.]